MMDGHFCGAQALDPAKPIMSQIKGGCPGSPHLKGLVKEMTTLGPHPMAIREFQRVAVKGIRRNG